MTKYISRPYIFEAFQFKGFEHESHQAFEAWLSKVDLGEFEIKRDGNCYLISKRGMKWFTLGVGDYLKVSDSGFVDKCDSNAFLSIYEKIEEISKDHEFLVLLKKDNSFVKKIESKQFFRFIEMPIDVDELIGLYRRISLGIPVYIQGYLIVPLPTKSS